MTARNAAALLAALMLAAACAAPAQMRETYQGRLDVRAEGEDADAIGRALTEAARARYGMRAPVAAVTADLEAQGFQCREAPPVEARSDYLVSACTLPKPHGFCSDLFALSLRYAGQDGSALRVRPDGAFQRTCIVPPSR